MEGGGDVDHFSHTITNNNVSLVSEEERIERIRKVLQYELDLEILHKWREVRLVEAEIERVKQVQLILEKILMNGNEHIKIYVFILSV